MDNETKIMRYEIYQNIAGLLIIALGTLYILFVHIAETTEIGTFFFILNAKQTSIILSIFTISLITLLLYYMYKYQRKIDDLKKNV